MRQVSKSSGNKTMHQNKKAVVLLSGGLDSATCLAMAAAARYECHALSVSYGQRHIAELTAANTIANQYQVKEHREISINLDVIGGSSLTDSTMPVPEGQGEVVDTGIPTTYVPARNTLFLSLALGYAESIGAFDIFIGVNAVDFSGYPDCRPDFISAFQQLTVLATKAGAENTGQFEIHTPLIKLTKAEIIKAGMELNLDYSLTVSCYQADSEGKACGRCDSCRLRQKGFLDAGVSDPTRYQ